MIGILRSFRRIVTIDTLKLLYNTIILPHFDYSDMVYDSASKTAKHRLQKLPTWIAKLISGAGPRESRNPILKSWGGYLFKIEEISSSVLWFSNEEMALHLNIWLNFFLQMTKYICTTPVMPLSQGPLEPEQLTTTTVLQFLVQTYRMTCPVT